MRREGKVNITEVGKHYKVKENLPLLPLEYELMVEWAPHIWGHDGSERENDLSQIRHLVIDRARSENLEALTLPLHP